MHSRRAPLQLLADTIGDAGTPLEALHALHALHTTLDDLKVMYVGRARADERTWAEIGSALGVTAQAAQQRYGG
jgi:hypothetical protein